MTAHRQRPEVRRSGRALAPLLPSVVAVLAAVAVWSVIPLVLPVADAGAKPAPAKPAKPKVPAEDAPPDPAAVEFFETRIRPVLVEHCQKCHDAKVKKGGLRLDSRAGWQNGGDSGPALVPGRPDSSLLIRMVRGGSESPPAMPPKNRLPASAVADLVKWVEMGAPDPRTGTAAPTAPAKGIDWQAAAAFWSFQPVRAVEPPPVADPRFASAVDRFVHAARTAKGLTPAAPADRATLLRRVTFGLTGLPPTQSDVQAFEADRSPDAFAKVVDRLLASPAYGEHQARQWLDLARYSDEQQHAPDGKFVNAWRYRDWVVESFNRDLPYDRFVKLQLAADLMEGPAGDPADRRALGFNGLGPIHLLVNDTARARSDQWDDRVDTITRVFLGLTVACARCHDHKFDPVPTQDYYSLAGVIASSREQLVPVSPREVTAAYDAAAARSADAKAAADAYLQAESDRLATLRTTAFPTYALAAWTHARTAAVAKSAGIPALQADAFARAVGLTPAQFRGIDQYLRKGGGRDKKLATWEGLLAKSPVPAAGSPCGAIPPEVLDVAAHFETSVRATLAKPLKQRNLDQYGSLFGGKEKDKDKDRGVFPMTEAAVLAAATDAWKAEFARLRDAEKRAAAAVPPEPARANGVLDVEKPADLKVFIRGNPHKTGEKAPRRFLRILAGPDAPAFTRGSGRLELAEAIASPANPLTARVIVNRVWAHHFGRGIVATPSNFGALGSRPTHPELLDHLAAGFVRGGWSIKALHRQIVLSATYAMASTADPKNHAVDPDNEMLWRMPRRRLTVEEFRDAVLAVTGSLDATVGGPGGAEPDDLKNVRRTLYARVSRPGLNNLLRLFDFPDPNITADRRTDTTLPQQALFLLNSPFMHEHARALAAKFATGPAPADDVRRMVGAVLARAPTAAELEIGTAYLSATDPAGDAGRNKLSRAERFAQALLAGNALMYVD